jgi:hypothetical protein
MRKGKQHTAQPNLETMEPRVAPSILGILAHQGQTVAAYVGQINNSIKEDKASQHANNEALKLLQHQQYLVHLHSLEQIPSALPTEAEKAASQVSNIFASIGRSL